MRKPFTPNYWACCAFFIFISQASTSQVYIEVRAASVSVLQNIDCDNLFFDITGDSDFAFEYAASDNTLGFSNNNPVAFGLTGEFNFQNNNNNNGPWNSNPNDLFFNHLYACPSDIPSQINISWQAYENDDPFFNWDLTGGFSDLQTGPQNVSIPVPGVPGSFITTFSASGSGGGCGTQNYEIVFEVTVIEATGITLLPDNICDALLVNTNTSYNVAVCSSATLEPGEPNAGDVDNTDASSWFKFVAPGSGSVEITTDLGGTEIGTYFQLYHAADGQDCSAGLQPISGDLIKDKFQYLSHIEFADGVDLLGIDPEAELTFDACNPIPLISYTKLIAGETYYVQMASDGNDQSGLVEVRVNDVGGSSGSGDDIPCQSGNVILGTNIISAANGDTQTSTIDFECAFNSGNDKGETGGATNGTNPNNFHAYDYDQGAQNNGNMNESIWLNFTAPNSGRIVFEADYGSILYAEHNALYGFDKRFAPGTPTDYTCANLEFLSGAEGGLNGFFGGNESAIISNYCLEPGYNYYGMIDPANILDPFSSTEMKSWLYDPSQADPSFNSPGNDILCLALQDTLYEVPVILAGTDPTFQAVSGSNVLACKEYLAGEPDAAEDPANCANQTVWHYFTAPPSGAVEISVRAYVGLDTVRYNIYELLNGTDCYGGLGPATFTQDGTQSAELITPVIQGDAGFEGNQESACCMTPGTLYAIQIDGGSSGDEGQYIIEYIQEVESDAGMSEITLANGNVVQTTDLDTSFICFSDDYTPGVMLNGIGESTASFPDCLTPGYILHDQNPVPVPVSGSGIESTIVESLEGDGSFTNDTDGSGTAGNPLFNTVYFLSPAADLSADWGQFSCLTSTASNGQPIVYLQELNPVYAYDDATCTVTFIADGGLNGFYGTAYDFTITNPSGEIVEQGQVNPGAGYTFLSPTSGLYSVDITDGACSVEFTYDASNCGNPCDPTTNNVNLSICAGESAFLEGAEQTEAGTYSEVYVTPQGCDSTVVTELTILSHTEGSPEYTICSGASIIVGTSSYDTEGVYTDTLVNGNGCDSIVTSTLFLLPAITASDEMTICMGSSYDFNGSAITTEGVYIETLTTPLGCDSIVYLSVFVTDPPIGYMEDVSICSDETYDFNGTILTESGSYYDTISAADGCDSIVRLELSVAFCDQEISNILTPNGDNINETWNVKYPDRIQGCTVRIFNRWGQLVFESNAYENTWKGTKDDEQLPDGVYYYSITGCDTDYNGSINLLRLKK